MYTQVQYKHGTYNVHIYIYNTYTTVFLELVFWPSFSVCKHKLLVLSQFLSLVFSLGPLQAVWIQACWGVLEETNVPSDVAAVKWMVKALPGNLLV